MAYNEQLAARIRKVLSRRNGIEEKTMFGGFGFMLNGNVCVGVWKDSLIVRMEPEDTEEALLEPHVKPFDITGRAMKGWVLVGADGIADEGDLKRWIQRAIRFVGKLPGK
ncbi:MAG: TfoX/Sxy family protein [Planctomycetes bacterium]|nr:TfoX/Sxy family protein [Planctomycetota bacterium]